MAHAIRVLPQISGITQLKFVIHCASMWRRMIFMSCVLFAVYAGAQQSGPILISHTDSTRAISFDSVTRRREPVSTTTQVKFGDDHATRIILYPMSLSLQPGRPAPALTAYPDD